MTQPQPTRRQLLGTTAGAASIALAGCLATSTDADDDGTDASQATGEPGDPAADVEVTLQSVPQPAIDPGIVHIQPGGTVTWIGKGIRNTVAAYHPETYGPQRIPDGAEPWNTGILRSESEETVAFPEEGIYDYADITQLCGTHEAFGIVGRVIVGWPDLAGQPAMEHDNDRLPSKAAAVMDAYDRQCHDVFEEAEQ